RKFQICIGLCLLVIQINDLLFDIGYVLAMVIIYGLSNYYDIGNWS
ncbi:unnamed protein product, partial [Rotaria sordida]